MTRTLILLAALAMPAAAFAQAKPAGTTDLRADVKAEKEKEFASIDANKDGKLEQVEIAAQLKREAEAELAQLRKERDDAFAKLDTDKNGSISKTEFDASAKLPDLKPADGSGMMTALDRNKDKTITQEEYVGNVLAIFDRFDANKDGKLTPAEKEAATKAARAAAQKGRKAVPSITPSKGKAATSGR